MTKKALVLTTLALFLGACTDNTADTGTTSTVTDVADGGTTTGTTTATMGAVGNTDTLTLQVGSDIPTLDPGNVYDTTSSAILENIYETLVTYDGSSISEFVPLLATEWEVSDDGLTYRFPIREGVKFHTGNPFTCADVEYTIQRNLVTNSSESGNWFMAEPLLGTLANANNDDSVTWASIDNAIECDGETAVFHLQKPDSAFVAKLAHPGQSIVDSVHAKEIGEWDATEATWKDWVGRELNSSALANNASGTGPYQLVSSDASSVIAKAFADYWGGAPSIQNVVRTIVPEESSRIQAFLNGDADLVDVPSREVLDAQLRGQPGVVVIEDLPSVGAYGFTMNEQLEGSSNLGSGTWGDGIPANFFQDPLMRECFTKAFDYDTYNEQVLLGKGIELNVMLPKTFLGYDESIPTPKYDIDAARTACEAAHGGEAWNKGFKLTASYSESSSNMRTALEILKTNIEGLNPKFQFNIQGLPWSEVVSTAPEQPMIFAGWSPDYADPDNFITTFYSSKGFYRDRSGIRDPKLEALITEARDTIDEDRRKELYSQITQYTSDMNYYLLIPSSSGVTVYHDNLQGRTADTYNPLYGGRWLWKNMSKQ